MQNLLYRKQGVESPNGSLSENADWPGFRHPDLIDVMGKRLKKILTNW